MQKLVVSQTIDFDLEASFSALGSICQRYAWMSGPLVKGFIHHQMVQKYTNEN